MSGLVFFDDEANNELLDEWMNQDSTVLAKDPVVGHSVDTWNPVTAASKGGLGFTDKAKSSQESKQKASIKERKENKEKQKRSALSGDEDLHGLVADDLEESRTSLLGKKANQNNRTIDDKAASVNPAAKKAKLTNVLAAANTEPAPTQATATKSNTSTIDIAPAKKSNKHQDLQTPAAVMEADAKEKRVNSRIRKRTKTRSKQKNIRKDNRADTLKPAHLVIKNKDYKGRPLTDRTKAVLGI